MVGSYRFFKSAAVVCLTLVASGCFEDREAVAKAIAEKIALSFRAAENPSKLDADHYQSLKNSASELEGLVEKYHETKIVKDIVGSGDLFGFSYVDFLSRLRDASYYHDMLDLRPNDIDMISSFEISKTCRDCIFGSSENFRILEKITDPTLISSIFLGTQLNLLSFSGSSLNDVKFILVDAQGVNFSRSHVNGGGVAAFFPWGASDYYSSEEVKNQITHTPDFVGSNFHDANFTGSGIEGAVFFGGNLSGADFSDSYFKDVAFVGVSAEGVSFKGIRLEDEIISGNDVDELMKNDTEDGPLVYQNSVYIRSYGGGYGTHYTREGRILLYGSDFSSSDFSGINEYSFYNSIDEGFKNGGLVIIGSNLNGANFARRSEAQTCNHEILTRHSDFTSAKFSGCRVRFNLNDTLLDRADFVGSEISFEGVLSGLSARAANFHKASVDFRSIATGSILADQKIMLDFRSADFSSATVGGFGHWGLGGNVTADFSGADFSEAMMSGAMFDGMVLAGQSFKNASLDKASFVGANLTGADFRGANLSDSNLSDANFSGANFLGSDLRGAVISNTNFCGAIGPNGDQMLTGCSD